MRGVVHKEGGNAQESVIICCWSINNIFSLFFFWYILAICDPFLVQNTNFIPFRDSLELVSWRIFYPQSKIRKVVLDGFPNVCQKWQISRINIILEFYWKTFLFPLKCLKAQVDLSWYWLALVIIARHAKWGEASAKWLCLRFETDLLEQSVYTTTKHNKAWAVSRNGL